MAFQRLFQRHAFHGSPLFHLFNLSLPLFELAFNLSHLCPVSSPLFVLLLGLLLFLDQTADLFFSLLLFSSSSLLFLIPLLGYLFSLLTHLASLLNLLSLPIEKLLSLSFFFFLLLFCRFFLLSFPLVPSLHLLVVIILLRCCSLLSCNSLLPVWSWRYSLILTSSFIQIIRSILFSSSLYLIRYCILVSLPFSNLIPECCKGQGVLVCWTRLWEI